MHLWQCALWGLLGGVAVEGFEWVTTIRRIRMWPWGKSRRFRGPFLFSVVVRIGLGGIVAAALGASGPVSVFSALAAGVAAPLILEKIAQQIPVETEKPAVNGQASNADPVKRGTTSNRHETAGASDAN